MDAGEDGNWAYSNVGIVKRADPGYVVALLPEIPPKLFEYLNRRNDRFSRTSKPVENILSVDFESSIVSFHPELKERTFKALKAWSEKYNIIVKY